MNPEISPASRGIITPEDFAKRVNTFSEGSQEAIATLSSALLEPDIRARIQTDPQEIKAVVHQLRGSGLAIKDIFFVMKYFGLPRQPTQPMQPPPMK